MSPCSVKTTRSTPTQTPHTKCEARWWKGDDLGSFCSHSIWTPCSHWGVNSSVYQTILERMWGHLSESWLCNRTWTKLWLSMWKTDEVRDKMTNSSSCCWNSVIGLVFDALLLHVGLLFVKLMIKCCHMYVTCIQLRLSLNYFGTCDVLIG